MFLTGYIDAMVTHLVEKTTILACLPIFKHSFDTTIVVLADKEW